MPTSAPRSPCSPFARTQATFGGVAGVSVMRTPREVPAVELPYDPNRHVDIGPPAHDDDAIFIPALDADPSDYDSVGPVGGMHPFADEE